MMKVKPGETVVFSYIVYKSRKHRDRVNEKVMKDPRLIGASEPKQCLSTSIAWSTAVSRCWLTREGDVCEEQNQYFP